MQIWGHHGGKDLIQSTDSSKQYPAVLVDLAGCRVAGVASPTASCPGRYVHPPQSSGDVTILAMAGHVGRPHACLHPAEC